MIKRIIFFLVILTMISCQKSADEYYNIAVADKESNNLLSAIENYSEVIEINPQFARAYFERGQTRHKIYLSKYSTIKKVMGR